jgi:kumamolisin
MSEASRFHAQPKVVLAGSERKPFSSTPAAHTSAAESDITVSVLLRRKTPIAPANFSPGQHLTREVFAERHGADPAATSAVEAFAAEYGLKAASAAEQGRRTLHLTGTPKAFEVAFGVTLHEVNDGGAMYRVREGSIYLPEELQQHVEAVLGLDNRPQAKPHFRVAAPHVSNVSYTPPQVAQLYSYPANAHATGQTIGLIELGGGYRPADVTAYFSSLKLTAPKLTAISVDGGANTPGDASGADGEVMLDIEVAASVAPGAALAVYFAGNTDQGFVDAITTAVHDTTNKPSVISISWGGPESTWTAQAITAMDQACQAAAAVGVTITVAAGDSGSSDGVSSGLHVDFPASSPHVLACGGTKLLSSGNAISSEVVWNEDKANEGATGGGVSTVFALPTWQAKAKVPAASTKSGGRGVPDVAGDADPSTGYSIRVDGQTMVIGGTSAVAPLWAGLIALANAANNTSAGFINPLLYAANEKTAFHDITQGNNGSFKAAVGWDACTGLGSPIGTGVIAVLEAKS